MYKWINKRFCLSVCLSVVGGSGRVVGGSGRVAGGEWEDSRSGVGG